MSAAPAMAPKPRLSAYVLTRNSERYLAEILDALRQIADEVLVLDSGSSDATEAIARAAGARFVYRAFDSFRRQREFAAAQCRHDYIFFCDSDEIPDATLIRSIQVAQQQGLSAAGYTVTRPWIVRGCTVHAIYPVNCPDTVPRMFDRRRCHWDPAKAVHETLLVDGPSVHLEGQLRHVTFHSLAEQERKLQSYTDLAAEQIVHKLQRRGGLTALRRAELLLKSWVTSPLGAIMKSYIVRGGWRDGRVGVSLLGYAVRYSSLRYRKAITRMAGSPPPASSPRPTTPAGRAPRE
ncbi:MAG: glycosyltransferase family 2 protein [Oceanococcaceae bacterium]